MLSFLLLVLNFFGLLLSKMLLYCQVDFALKDATKLSPSLEKKIYFFFFPGYWECQSLLLLRLKQP